MSPWWYVGGGGILIILFFWWVFPFFYHGIPWQPTDMVRVRRMLEMASVSPGELVYDLGCGDGRILVCAAREFKAMAEGFEINPWLVLLARLRIWSSRLSKQVRVRLQDIYTVDLSKADVITMFLFQHVNDRLDEKFRRELKDGARIVSYVWILKGWKPSHTDPVKRLYLYKKQ